MALTRLMTLLLHDVYRRDPGESGFPGAAADRYKLSVRELDAQLGRLAGALDARPVLVSEPPRPEHAAVPVAITVDDGGVSYYTAVAERLEALGWRGHCLVTTGFIGRPGFLRTPQLRELHARGHLIGTHSATHPQPFAACPWDRMVREWSDSRKKLQDILGADVKVGSVPGGSLSGRVVEAAEAAGLRVLFTSEPQTRVWREGCCEVMGRFTVRAGSRPDLARDFAMLRRGPLFREWAVWNGKKVLKGLLGAGYPRLAQWAGRVGAQAVRHAH